MDNIKVFINDEEYIPNDNNTDTLEVTILIARDDTQRVHFKFCEPGINVQVLQTTGERND